MDYAEARAFIRQVSAAGNRPGLKAVKDLLHLLGDPQEELKFIHVAGTNGKGSVLAYLEEILRQAGYKVGKYVSPTLFSYRERMQTEGRPISREAFAKHTGRAAAAVEEMERLGLGLPTVFEVETAISFLYFRETACDYVLLETGMGGRLDATNVIRTPVLTVFTPIGMDHMEYLGDTLEAIARNKAGIVKEKVPVVSAHQADEAARAIRREAAARGCVCRFVRPEDIRCPVYGLETQSFQYKGHGRIRIRLAGVYQIENGALALECVDMLREHGAVIPEECVRRGMEQAEWKGRFTVIGREPFFVIDGAHNPDGARKLRASVEKYFSGREKYYIFGVFSDKDYDKIIEITAGLATHIFTVETPDNPRALPAGELARAVSRVNPSVEAAEGIGDAVEKAYGAAGREDVILAFGSLSFLAEAERAVRKRNSAENAVKNRTDGENE